MTVFKPDGVLFICCDNKLVESKTEWHRYSKEKDNGRAAVQADSSSAVQADSSSAVQADSSSAVQADQPIDMLRVTDTPKGDVARKKEEVVSYIRC